MITSPPFPCANALSRGLLPSESFEDLCVIEFFGLLLPTLPEECLSSPHRFKVSAARTVESPS